MAELRSRYWSAWSLSIGTIKLADGRGVKGFLVEATATIGARDISSFGGWRAFLAREQIPAWIRSHAGTLSEGLGATTAPMCSSAWATRRAISSRQGAAMICTPIGSGCKGTGTATTGKPMNEIGCV